MAWILSIDASTENASVGLFHNTKKIGVLKSFEQRDHASFIQPAIYQILNTANIQINDIEAVAVTEGPGSYTGLRVAMASAKGICFAKNKPLILINTLTAMVVAAKNNFLELHNNSKDIYFCPMIDARRMDVFSALYKDDLALITPIQALTIEENYWDEWLENNQIVFSGNGSIKAQSIIKNPNAIFSNAKMNVEQVNELAQMKYLQAQFSDIAYSQPNYYKEFYTTARPNQLV